MELNLGKAEELDEAIVARISSHDRTDDKEKMKFMLWLF